MAEAIQSAMLNRSTEFPLDQPRGSPAIVVLDRQGSVDPANSAFEKCFQEDRREFATIDMANLRIPGDKGTVSAPETQSTERREDGAQMNRFWISHCMEPALPANGEIRGA